MASKKRDDGIARLSNNIIIPEELRDRIVRQYASPREPNKTFDPNRATSKELQEHVFSGYRVNVFTNDVELWVLGRVYATRNWDKVKAYPSLMADMHEEVFATKGSVVTTDITQEQLNKINRNDWAHKEAHARRTYALEKKSGKKR